MLSVASSSGIRKRRHEFDQGSSSGIKLPRAEFYFVLESESDITSSEEDKESVSSIQNKSTDFAKDTSDTSSKTSRYESDFESLAGVEYEVMSLSDHQPENPFSSYSTGTESIGWREPLGEASESEAQSMWADDSSATSDLPTRPAQPQLPFRSCVKCKAQTNVLQYCHSCYKIVSVFETSMANMLNEAFSMYTKTAPDTQCETSTSVLQDDYPLNRFGIVFPPSQVIS